MAGGKSFFPGVAPASLSPLLQNSVAMGGFTAFVLSTLAYLSPKQGVSGSFALDMAEIPRIHALLAAGRDKLALSQERLDALCLCCEEVFIHMAQAHSSLGHSLTLRASLKEEGCFAELVCGHMMDDINNFALPESLLQANPDELDNLGLALFARYAREVKHLEISGYSYISFLL